MLSYLPPIWASGFALLPNLLTCTSKKKKKKDFVFISIPIAYDSRSTFLWGWEMLIWKIAQTCTEVANLNFWCSSSFCVSSSGVTDQPQRRHAHTSQPIIVASSCTCPLLPCVWVCSPAPGQGAIKADASLQLNSKSLTEQWWHLMRKVQEF